VTVTYCRLLPSSSNRFCFGNGFNYFGRFQNRNNSIQNVTVGCIALAVLPILRYAPGIEGGIKR
jgi:hypothetical protein